MYLRRTSFCFYPALALEPCDRLILESCSLSLPTDGRMYASLWGNVPDKAKESAISSACATSSSREMHTFATARTGDCARAASKCQ